VSNRGLSFGVLSFFPRTEASGSMRTIATLSVTFAPACRAEALA
jgi:hypothetical protein